jgi:hypothetical protein
MPADPFDALDPSVACHPILPANVPIDLVRYSSVVPVTIVKNGKSEPLHFPTNVVIPNIFANVNLRNGAHAAAVQKSLRQVEGFSVQWAEAKVLTRTTPSVARIGSLSELLASGSLKLGDIEVKASLSKSALLSLAQGFPARIQVRDQGSDDLTEITVEPDYPLSGGDYQVSLDDSGQTDLLQSGTVQVAQVGRKRIRLNTEAIQQLISAGEASVAFEENSDARLTIYSASSADTSFAGRVTSSTVNGYDLRRLPLNVADTYAMHSTKIRSSMAWGGPSVTTTGAPPSSGSSTAVQVVLPEFPMVLYIPYLQEWTLDGYARGALLNTLSLAPQEETTIEVMSYQRRKRESEASTAFESESMLESSVNNKDTTEVIDEAKRESGWKFDASATVSVPGVPIGGSINFGIKDELVKSSKSTVGQIVDATSKASNRIKATRQTKVTETEESGTENKVVRRLRNPNLGMTLNLDAFEVVAHYSVATHVEMEEVRLAVLVEMYDFLAPMLTPGKGQKESLLAFESVLEPYLPSKLRAGFSAAHMLLANERLCTFHCMPACDCSAASGQTGTAPVATTPEQQNQLRLVEAIGNVRDAINTINSAGVENLGRTIKQHWDNLLDQSMQPPASQWDAGRLEVKRYLYRRFALDGPAQRFWSQAKSFAQLSQPDEAAASRLIVARAVQGSDALNAIASFVTLQIRVVGELATIIGSGWPLVAPDMLLNGLGFDDAGLESALDALKTVLDDIAKSRQPPPSDPNAGPKDVGAGQVADVAGKSDKPYADKDLAEASVDLDVMLLYMRNNANFFRGVLWRSINPADRLRFLGIYGRLQELTTGRILGFSGTAAVIEVDVSRDRDLENWFADNVQKNANLRELIQNFKTILPTPGVTLEARRGACDALEPYLTQSREHELHRVEAVAKQEWKEIERLDARIAANLLDDPKPAAPVVKVQSSTVPGP